MSEKHKGKLEAGTSWVVDVAKCSAGRDDRFYTGRIGARPSQQVIVIEKRREGMVYVEFPGARNPRYDGGEDRGWAIRAMDLWPAVIRRTLCRGD
jgi:hypothetical protein